MFRALMDSDIKASSIKQKLYRSTIDKKRIMIFSLLKTNKKWNSNHGYLKNNNHPCFIYVKGL